MAKPSTHAAVDWDAVYTAHGQEFLSNTPKDNYFTGNPTLDYLKADQGSYSGGDYLIEPLIHTGQSGTTSIARGQQFSLAVTDPVTAAEYRIAHYVSPVTIYKEDEVKAGGMGGRLNLVETYIDNVRSSAERTLSQHLWATSQASTTDINPLPVLISTDGLGTVGNINRTTYTFWRNKRYSTITASTGLLDKMRSLLNDVSRGNKGGTRPGLIVTTQSVYEAYMDLAEQAHVINTNASSGQSRIADLGFPVANYQGIPITWDENCPSGRMYFLNKEGVKMRTMGKGWTLTPFQSTYGQGIAARTAVLEGWFQTSVSESRILGQLDTIT